MTPNSKLSSSVNDTLILQLHNYACHKLFVQDTIAEKLKLHLLNLHSCSQHVYNESILAGCTTILSKVTLPCMYISGRVQSSS